MTAAFRFAPQYAVTRISSSPHCTVQLATSQGDRTTLMPAMGPGGPGSPLAPGGPGGPGSPFGPSLRPQLITAPASTTAATVQGTRMAIRYGAICAHTATSGLFAGPAARPVAARPAGLR